MHVCEVEVKIISFLYKKKKKSQEIIETLIQS